MSTEILEQIIAGATAGCVSAVVTVPLDVIKTRYQIQNHHSFDSYRSIPDAVKKIYREEKIRGFYRGVTPSILALLPNWAIYFTCYDWTKNQLKQSQASKMLHRSRLRINSDILVHSLCAMFAGALSTTASAPFWMVKARMMTQHFNPALPKYKHTFDAFAKIIAQEGFFALFKGLSASLFGVFHVGVQLPVYELLKSIRLERIKARVTTIENDRLANYRQYQIKETEACGSIKTYWVDRDLYEQIIQSSSEELEHIHAEILPSLNDQKMLTTLDIIFASTISKLIASTIWYPHEIIRTRMQVSVKKNTTIKYIIADVLRQGGVFSLWRGLGVTLVRAVPTCVVTFTVYEKTSHYLRDNKFFN